MSEAATAEPGFRHEVFFYADADEFLAGTVPFVRAGLEAEEAVCEAVASDSYLAPDDRSSLDGRLAPAPRDAAEMSFAGETLSELRRFVDERAGSLGLDRSRVDDFVLAAGELATNSLRHGGGRGMLRIWGAGDTIVCEVDDEGRIDQPLVGRERPRADQLGGRGLWLANQVCDLVQVRSGGAGSTVRLRMSRAGD